MFRYAGELLGNFNQVPGFVQDAHKYIMGNESNTTVKPSDVGIRRTIGRSAPLTTPRIAKLSKEALLTELASEAVNKYLAPVYADALRGAASGLSQVIRNPDKYASSIMGHMGSSI
tara:strand:+ start:245 stop:592 length:348 start_codon:yes stop_codon:yes gene_type:complete